jgi:fatty acid desaturase
MEVTVLVAAITTYVRAGEDNDDGALAGSRADERQKMLSLRARALGWNFAMVAAFTGLTIAVAVKATWWWPFLVILAVAGFGQLLGWSTYTTAEEGPADDASPQHEARSPAS